MSEVGVMIRMWKERTTWWGGATTVAVTQNEAGRKVFEHTADADTEARVLTGIPYPKPLPQSSKK